MGREIIFLVDYKGVFYTPHKHTNESTNLDVLAEYFERKNFHLTIKAFQEIDFRTQNYKDKIIAYQSSQDNHLYYKGYIEDIVLGLSLQDARLIPDFHLFRAHHNKVFWEILRDLSDFKELQTLDSQCFGTYEDFVTHLDRIPFPAVIKRAQGDSSRAVALAKNKSEAKKIARSISRSFSLKDAFFNWKQRLKWSDWLLNSQHRNKFIVQEFVPNLDRDWKILAFGEKFFIEFRPVRKGDFRASGSKGRRVFPTELPDGMLDYLEKVFLYFQTPYASIDVLHEGKNFYLSEIQFLRFGTRPLIDNTHYWTRKKGEWTLREGDFEWERELAVCLMNYIKQMGWTD